MKKILHVVNIYFVIPYFLGDQLLFFNDLGYKEHIACSPSQELEHYATQKKFNYIEVPIKRSISVFSDLRAVLKLSKYIKKNKIDIVVGHTPKGALIAMLAGSLSAVPNRIYFRHGLVYETSSGIKRAILKIADKLSAYFAHKVVCVSPSVFYQSLEDNLNLPDKQVLLNRGTCNGIDVKRFCRANICKNKVAELRSKHGINDEYVIGFTGRLVVDKGIIMLVDAFIEFNKQYKKSKLLLVGLLEKRDELPQETIQLIKSHPDIIYTGYVDNSHMEAYYALMKVFVLPSYREGFPTSVLEASSMGIPVVTTRATGCIDSIINGHTGFFMDFSSECLKKLLLKLYSNQDMAITMGQSGREFVVENFRQEVVWNEIEKLYL